MAGAQQAELVETALRLAARGWAVHPLAPQAKTPATTHGFKDATRAADVIRGWWRRRPRLNVGIATGRESGFWALDVDEGKGGADTIDELQRRFGPLPQTLRVRTGSGYHDYWAYPTDRTVTNAGAPGVGVDVRGDGGYVVGPGSIHPSGAVYSIERDLPIVPAPSWLLDLVTRVPVASGLEVVREARAAASPPTRRTRPLDEDAEVARRATTIARARRELDTAGVGGRNKLLNRWAYTLAGLGLSAAEVEHELWPAVQGWIGQPPADPFTRKEFLKTLHEGVGAGASRPLPPAARGRRSPHLRTGPEGAAPKSAPDPAASPAPKEVPPPAKELVTEAPGPASAPEAKAGAAEVDWEGLLARNPKTWAIRGTQGNAHLITRHEPRLECLAWNEFDGRPWLLSPPPWALDGDTYPAALTKWDVTACGTWMQIEFEGTEWTSAKLDDAIERAAMERHRWHPVREYLASVTWDGVPRCDEWLSDFFAVERTEYTRAVAAKWLISCVARAFEPGCKVDTVLVLEGDQSFHKSQALKLLGGRWFKDDKLRLGPDTPIELLGVWIYEVAELAGFRKGEIQDVKAFLTQSHDRYRPKYARRWIEQPRSCVFAATTNEQHYLVDTTGNRRWWPVKCQAQANLELLAKARDQLWAESVHRYRAGEAWWLKSVELEQEAAAAAEARLELHPWEDELRRWAENRHEATTREALAELGVERKVQTHRHLSDVGAALRRLGFTRIEYRRLVGGGRERVYVRAPSW